MLVQAYKRKIVLNSSATTSKNRQSQHSDFIWLLFTGSNSIAIDYSAKLADFYCKASSNVQGLPLTAELKCRIRCVEAFERREVDLDTQCLKIAEGLGLKGHFLGSFASLLRNLVDKCL